MPRDLISIPSRGSGKGDGLLVHLLNFSVSRFQSPLGEVVKETVSSVNWKGWLRKFQSPLGEVVKETIRNSPALFNNCVSIPSRGSGKGDWL